MLFKTRSIQAIWFAGILHRPVFIFSPSRPGLFLSVWPQFLERGKFFQQIFPGLAPQKLVSAYFSPDYYTAPGLSTYLESSKTSRWPSLSHTPTHTHTYTHRESSKTSRCPSRSKSKFRRICVHVHKNKKWKCYTPNTYCILYTLNIKIKQMSNIHLEFKCISEI